MISGVAAAHLQGVAVKGQPAHLGIAPAHADGDLGVDGGNVVGQGVVDLIAPPAQQEVPFAAVGPLEEACNGRAFACVHGPLGDRIEPASRGVGAHGAFALGALGRGQHQQLRAGVVGVEVLQARLQTAHALKKHPVAALLPAGAQVGPAHGGPVGVDDPGLHQPPDVLGGPAEVGVAQIGGKGCGVVVPGARYPVSPIDPLKVVAQTQPWQDASRIKIDHPAETKGIFAAIAIRVALGKGSGYFEEFFQGGGGFQSKLIKPVLAHPDGILAAQGYRLLQTVDLPVGGDQVVALGVAVALGGAFGHQGKQAVNRGELALLHQAVEKGQAAHLEEVGQVVGGGQCAQAVVPVGPSGQHGEPEVNPQLLPQQAVDLPVGRWGRGLGVGGIQGHADLGQAGLGQRTWSGQEQGTQDSSTNLHTYLLFLHAADQHALGEITLDPGVYQEHR